MKTTRSLITRSDRRVGPAPPTLSHDTTVVVGVVEILIEAPLSWIRACPRELRRDKELVEGGTSRRRRRKKKREEYLQNNDLLFKYRRVYIE